MREGRTKRSKAHHRPVEISSLRQMLKTVLAAVMITAVLQGILTETLGQCVNSDSLMSSIDWLESVDQCICHTLKLTVKSTTTSQLETTDEEDGDEEDVL